MIEFTEKDQVREALHVGNNTWHGTDDLVYAGLYADITRSVRPWLETLLDNYRVLIYNGQLDIIVGYALTEGYLPVSSNNSFSKKGFFLCVFEKNFKSWKKYSSR